MQKYRVWCSELGSTVEDGRDFMAHDHEDAACRWARREDAESADYWIVGGEGTTVQVQGQDGKAKALRVTGEQAIDYRARPALETPNVELRGVPFADAKRSPKA